MMIFQRRSKEGPREMHHRQSALDKKKDRVGSTTRKSKATFTPPATPDTMASYDNIPNIPSPQRRSITPLNMMCPSSPPKLKRMTRDADSGAFHTGITFEPTILGEGSGSNQRRNSFMTPEKKSSITSTIVTPQKNVSKERSTKKPLSHPWRGKNKDFKFVVPKAFSSAKKRKKSRQNAAVDLSRLAIPSISLIPRNGAGMKTGRHAFERVRTSTMLHMIREQDTDAFSSSSGQENDGGKGVGVTEKENTTESKNEETPLLEVDRLLQACIANPTTTFADKSNEVVSIAMKSIKKLKEKDDNAYSFSQDESDSRNVTSIQFLTGAYREVVRPYEEVDGTKDFVRGKKTGPSSDALSLMIVGASYYARGNYKSALAVYQKAGVGLKKKLSTSPEYMIHCAKLFNNMGCVYFEMNKYEKAMQTFQRALELFQDDHHDDYDSWVAAIMDQALIMGNMAYTLIKFKQFDDASDLVNASFELQHILPGVENTAMTVSTLSTMAFIYYRTKNYDQALKTYSACAKIQGSSSIYDSRDKVDVLTQMATICKKTKMHDKAAQLYRCILLHQQEFLCEDDEDDMKDMMDTNSSLADALQNQARWSELSVLSYGEI